MGAALFALFCAAGQAQAQNADPAAPRMVVEARELIRDEKSDKVVAIGDVQIYYKGRVLEADRVTYDRKTGRVYAQGNAKLTEANGQISYADELDLTEDLRQGFIEGLRSETADKTYLSSPRAEYAGDARVYERTTNTACAPCENDPDRAPIWRVRARKVIHKVDEQNLYFEDARVEFFGFPLSYLPYFSIPDPSVKRRSGFLNPHFFYKSQLGTGAGVPIFWAVAPNIDVTFTPTFLTKQGLLAEIELKHRLENGAYGVRLDGIRPLNPSAFAVPPFGAANRTFRGSISTAGEFRINEQWKYGWDAVFLTDKYFLTDFRLNDPLLNNIFFREVSSTAYLTGKGRQSFFDLRGFVFQSLSVRDFQPQIGKTLPYLEYNRIFALPPEKSGGIGGEVELDVQAMHTQAEAALYEPINPRTIDSVYASNYVCQFYTPGLTRNTSQCLLRGIGGDFSRGTVQASWQRRFIDPIGQTWTPFVFLRGSGSYLSYDTTRVYGIYNYLYQPLPNAAQGLFVGSNNVGRGNILPGIGLEYRYPFFAQTPLGSVTFEPIAQIVARPDRPVGSNSLVNIDSQSLVFDDSTLFSWNKFSGYDRFETGTRFNYGGQFTLNLPNGGFFNAMAGQSIQIAGRNGFATGDAANVGLSSGLDTRRSDYVGRLAFAPNATFSFVAKGRFDVNTLSLRRADLVAGATLGPLTLTAQYANYAAQPAIGFDIRRQGFSFGGRYEITPNYFVNGNITFDLSRHLYNQLTGLPAFFFNPVTGQGFALAQPVVTGSAPLFSVAGVNVGGGYRDECTTLSVNYSSVYQPNFLSGPTRNHTLLVSLQLRTLAQGSFGVGLGSTPIRDGISQLP